MSLKEKTTLKEKENSALDMPCLRALMWEEGYISLFQQFQTAETHLVSCPAAGEPPWTVALSCRGDRWMGSEVSALTSGQPLS